MPSSESMPLLEKMSQSESIFTSAESEKRWVLAMEKNFNPLFIVDMPFCVFRVPKKVAEAKPEAYAPRQLGLGPLHHLRPDLHAMNNHKLLAIAKFFPLEKLQNLRLAVDALVGMEPVIRASYDQYLDLDIETLAWIIAIDGLYLLQLLKNYPEMKHFAGDMLILENQIPLILIEKILQVFELSPAGDNSLLGLFQAFFEDQSPLELDSVIECTNYTHLLHRMYFLIVNNRGFITPQTKMADLQLSDVVQGAQFLAERGVPGAGTAGQILSLVSALPWGKISGMFKKDGSDPSPSADEIDIPSVSQMTDVAGIRFVRTDGGIRDVRFDDEKTAEKKFYLPVIRITATTEIVLRNLVAYEAAAEKSLELAEYVDLMCGIIDSRRDVEILREAEIVRSEMDDEEIARIFNGISKSEKKKKNEEERSSAEEAADGVNARYNSLQRVKLRKLAGKYGQGCLKVTSVAAAIVVVLLLSLQAYCSVFGCRLAAAGSAATKSKGALQNSQLGMNGEFSSVLCFSLNFHRVLVMQFMYDIFTKILKLKWQCCVDREGDESRQ